MTRFGTGWKWSRLCRSLGDRSAGVALMFAVSVIPVVGLIGVAIDLGVVTQAGVQLNSAADAAALTAAKIAANAFSAGQHNYIATGQAAGLQWFYSQAGSVSNASPAAPSVTVTQTGSVFVSKLSYQSTVTPYFARLFGVSTIPIAGLSSATITANAYVSVTFLLDNSSSMLIAATQAGVNAMNAATPTYATSMKVPSGLGGLGCAFACHWDAGGNDYYGKAKGVLGIQLRFDVVQDAVASAINQMIGQQVIADQFSVGIYTFGNALTQVYPVGVAGSDSTDLIDSVAAASSIQSPVTPDVPNTNFSGAMSQLAGVSSMTGNGSSVAQRKKALIIVTDGMADYGSRAIPSARGPFNPAACSAMKNLGYQIYVLYTTYITTPTNLLLPFENIALLPYITGVKTPSIASALQSCASAPGNYAQASDPVAINAAMSQMLQAALGNGGRFTQ